MHSESRVSEAWKENRAYLVNLAFGILGNLGAAEDAVQEAFTRLVASDDDGSKTNGDGSLSSPAGSASTRCDPLLTAWSRPATLPSSTY